MSGTEAFFAAVSAGDATKVSALLNEQPGLASAKNERGLSAMMAAVYSGRREIRDVLLTRGVVLELHEAAAAGVLARVKDLVEKDPLLAKSFSPDGFPVFALAAVFGRKEVVEYLFAKGADVDAVSTNGTGYTALTGAVTSGHEAIVAFLLAHGADANYRYGPGYTPLLAAAANGHLEIVKLLVAHDADLQAKSNDGQTALNIAEARGHKEVSEYLRELAAG
jgi:ankyrin repeat protein